MTAEPIQPIAGGTTVIQNPERKAKQAPSHRTPTPAAAKSVKRQGLRTRNPKVPPKRHHKKIQAPSIVLLAVAMGELSPSAHRSNWLMTWA